MRKKLVQVVGNLIVCPFCGHSSFVYIEEFQPPVVTDPCIHNAFEYFDDGEVMEFVFEIPEEGGEKIN